MKGFGTGGLGGDTVYIYIYQVPSQTFMLCVNVRMTTLLNHGYLKHKAKHLSILHYAYWNQSKGVKPNVYIALYY